MIASSMTVVMVDSRREFAPCHPSARIQSAGAAAWCGQCGSSVDPFESRPATRLVPLTIPAGESA